MFDAQKNTKDTKDTKVRSVKGFSLVSIVSFVVAQPDWSSEPDGSSLSLLVAAAFGAVLGSFLNVCIHRLPRGASVVVPPSACPQCGHELSWFENIPIVSWLALRGRCRACRGPIGIRYPIIEAITAAMFAAAWWYYGPTPLLVSRLVFGCALIVLFAIDLEHQLLPNVITLPGIPVGFLFSLITEPGWMASLIGILAGGGVLFAVAEGYRLVRHEEGLGMGDVKMLAMVGAFLGWRLTLVTLMMASLGGSMVGVLLIVTGRGTMKYALPFGTFLALGAAAAATVGPAVLDWYLGLL
jgi:leader peptidase (prepilin peptidase) / N-methyltransferase